MDDNTGTGGWGMGRMSKAERFKAKAEAALKEMQEEQARRLRAVAEWMVEAATVFEDTYGMQVLDFDHPDQFSSCMAEIAETSGNSVEVLNLMAERLKLEAHYL